METISLTSKVLHRLGSFFIGTPKSLDMPADFYTDIGDREQPLQQDIRKREVIGAKILTNVYRLSLTDRVGPIASVMCFVAILGLSAVSVQITKWGTDIKSTYDTHEAKVAQQTKAAAVQSLGDLNQANCTAQVSNVNALMSQHKAAQDWSPEDQALMNFASNCAGREFLAATGNPLQYHARKFSTASLGVLSSQTCQSHLADFNAETSKDNWRYSADPDDTALNAFMSSCQLRGFLHTADPAATHPVYH